jgi:hypothetical protein
MEIAKVDVVVIGCMRRDECPKYRTESLLLLWCKDVKMRCVPCGWRSGKCWDC